MKTTPASKLLCRTRTENHLENIDKCHLERFSRYTWLIKLRMTGTGGGLWSGAAGGGGDVFVHTSDGSVLGLEQGQNIRVIGTLVVSDNTVAINNVQKILKL